LTSSGFWTFWHRIKKGGAACYATFELPKYYEKYILTIIIREYYNPIKREHKVELFLTFIPGLIIMIVATVVFLHKASENKNAEKL